MGLFGGLGWLFVFFFIPSRRQLRGSGESSAQQFWPVLSIMPRVLTRKTQKHVLLPHSDISYITYDNAVLFIQARPRALHCPGLDVSIGLHLRYLKKMITLLLPLGPELRKKYPPPQNRKTCQQGKQRHLWVGEFHC